jgi:hypothetical protein
MAKTKKVRSTNSSKTRKNKGKIFGADKYLAYDIHKCTLISYDPLLSCKTLIKLFGQKNMSKIITPPDPTLAKRGIKWVRCLKGGKAEFHFVPPFDLNDNKTLRRLVAKQDKESPLKSQFYENHIGMYVPDLTPVIISALTMKLPCQVTHRADGLHQFYVDIPGCLDYLDVDSLVLDIDAIQKKFPSFTENTFADNMKFTKREQSKARKTIKQRQKHNKLKKFSVKTMIFEDPIHNNALRKLSIHNDGKITIVGKDSPRGKTWNAKGSLTGKDNNLILDFSSKGGPKDIKAKFVSSNTHNSNIKFADGNVWKAVEFYSSKK